MFHVRVNWRPMAFELTSFREHGEEWGIGWGERLPRKAKDNVCPMAISTWRISSHTWQFKCTSQGVVAGVKKLGHQARDESGVRNGRLLPRLPVRYPLIGRRFAANSISCSLSDKDFRGAWICRWTLQGACMKENKSCLQEVEPRWSDIFSTWFKGVDYKLTYLYRGHMTGIKHILELNRGRVLLEVILVAI